MAAPDPSSAAAAQAKQKDPAVIIDLAFDRAPDPYIDAANPRSAPSPVSAGSAPRSPVAVRVLPDGTTTPAPDIELVATPIAPTNGVNGHTNGHGNGAAAAIAALPGLSNGHAAGANAAGASEPVSPKAATPKRKTLADVGLGLDAQGRNPEERASICERLFYSHATPLITLANEQSMEVGDMWPIAKSDEALGCTRALETEFQRRKAEDPNVGVLGSCITLYRWLLFEIFWCEIPAKAEVLIQPLFLTGIIDWVIDPTQATWIGYVYGVAMCVFAAVANITITFVQELNMKMMIRVRAAVSGMVYEKSLRLSNAGRKETTIGAIVNLMSSDADKVAQTCSFALTGTFLVPAQLGLLIWLIYRIMGPSTFAGLGILFGIIPILFVVILRTMVLYERRAGLADQRVKLTSEVLQGIRVVKFYGWEQSFHERLTAIRQTELLTLRSLNFYSSFFIFFFLMLPTLISITSFGVYVRSGNVLNVADVFRALAYFNALQIPMIDMPSAFAQLVQGAVASARLNTFLGQKEITSNNMADGTTVAVAGADGKPVSVASLAPAAAANGNSTAVDEVDDPVRYPISIRGGDFRWDPRVEEPDEKEEAAKAKKAAAAREAAEKAGPDALAAYEKEVAAEKERQAIAAEKAKAAAEELTLRNINFRAERGKLTAIVGKVGAGKTSLLSAILGEIRRAKGVVRSAEHISFVAQTAWIQNMSVADNIRFGLPLDKARYDDVVKATALDTDLAILPAGSNTEIGEKGINLSGGQKQRVALSRAMYSANDILAMDDPLSAVDAHVAEHIFTKCFTGFARGRTRVLVTNQLHFLPRCDYIYVIANGTIAEHGTYEQLAARGEGSEFRLLMSTHMTELDRQHEAKQLGAQTAAGAVDAKHGGDEKKLTKQPSSGAAAGAAAAGGAAEATRKAQTKRGQLVQKEELSTSKVSFQAYLDHFQAMGGWPWMVTLAIIFVIGQAGVTLSSFWLSWWANDAFHKSSADGQPDNTWYLTGMGLLAVVSAVFLLARSLVFAQTSVYASHKHHSALLASVQRAPASFFDETPVGRILNRFSKDMDDVDTGLPNDLSSVGGVLAMVFGNMIAIGVVTPLFLIAVALVAVVFYFIQRYYKAAALQSERINSITRSPIFQNFTETLTGVTTIRAYGATERFRELNYRLLDANTQAMYTARLIFRWAAVRTGCLNAFLSFFAALFVCIQRDTIDPGLVGVNLTFVLAVGGFLGYLLQMVTELENKMNSVERVQHYTTKVPAEAAWVLPGEPALPKTGPQEPQWPSRGDVEIDDLVMTYRPGLEPAIKGLTCRFASREKIGVAGRTGSGKSSLMLCLFRMYEAKGGAIRIDGVDISKVGLHTLRKRLAIIPQDPVVFSGTLRQNLDPFREYNDAQVWAALEAVHLKPYAEKQPKGLDCEVAEYGENLSVGQCQLICIARALLRDPRIILMDEATSSIDSVTDALIQKTVAERFANSTVITIAHRLNTIMDSNRILVMRDGRAAEFDAPQKLIAAKGVFASMHKSMLEAGHASGATATAASPAAAAP